MMIGTNPKLLYNRRKLLLLAAKGGCICTPSLPYIDVFVVQ